MKLSSISLLAPLVLAATSLAQTDLIAQEGLNSSEPLTFLLPQKIYGDDNYMVLNRRSMPTNTTRARVPNFPAGTFLLKEGTIRREGARPLLCDIVLERDVKVTLRDGVTMYTNVFRPAGNGTYPVLFGWSPYGKEFGGQWLDDVPGRLGISLSAVSELQRFEGADPAYWVNQGYVVLSPDPRGVGKSEGNIHFWGRQLAEDGYDFIEWAAKQAWSSGKVAMTGNSFLGASQWFIAAEQPPSLAAIAPWEGFSDHFREIGNLGGVPATTFAEIILQTFSGPSYTEDQPAMIVHEKFRTAYWLDKQAQLEKVDVPAYVVASWTNVVHTHGTFAGYRGISSSHKWLRVHNTQEWIDYYDPVHVEDLRKFFDHYLKNVNNGWETTPKVRLSILNPGATDIVNRTEEEFPLARTQYTPLYLTANSTAISNGTLETQQSETTETISYETTGGNAFTLTKTFDVDTEITGYMSLRLWVEAIGSTDMELAIGVQKLDTTGKPYTEAPMTTLTASGVIRVSSRRLDEKHSTTTEPTLLHMDEQLLEPGQIVPVDVNIWPMGMIYRKGESLQLSIGERNSAFSLPDLGYGVPKITIAASGGTYVPGTNVSMVTLGGSAEFPTFVKLQQQPLVLSRNNGTHKFYMGKGYDSHLLIPFIPPSA